jgi:outer membrane receptor protein involved in Fe transport
LCGDGAKLDRKSCKSGIIREMDSVTRAARQHRLGVLHRNTARLALIAGMGFAVTGPALAQDANAQQSGTAVVAPQPAADQATAPDIIVTGSRVDRAGYSAPTPVTVVGAELLVDRAPSVLVDAIKLLPAARNTSTPGTAGNSISGGGGGSYINLRGLGPNRTLVLLNGQRMIPTTNIGTIDIAVFPQSLVKRIDVVTGGASAAYGSDAVAGVANLVLDTDLKGLRANVEGGISSHGDAGTQKASLAWGGQIGERLHLVVGGEYYNADPAPVSGRNDLFYPVALVSNPDFTPTNGQKTQIVAPYAYLNNQTFGGLITGGPLANTQFLPGGATSAYTPCGRVSGVLQVCAERRDDLIFFQRIADLTTPQRRYSGYGAVRFDLSNAVTLKADFLYGESTTTFHSVPPATSVLGTYPIQQDNAYLPEAVRARMAAAGVTSFPLARFSMELGPAQFTRFTNVKRGSLGLDANLGNSWKATAYSSYAESNYNQRYDNALIPSLFNKQVDAVVDPANGRIVCRSTLTNPTDGCIPINLFGEGAPDPAAKSYSYGTGYTRLHSSQVSAGGSVSGEPFATWAGSISVAVGVEYRRDKSDQTVDANQLAKRFAYSNQQPVSGAISVKEAYFETVVPLAKDTTFARTLEVNGAVRVTDYSTSGTVTTWKVGGNYEPIDGVRFRAVRSRDIRAPNILELNSPTQLVSAGNVGTDPRTGTSVVFASYSGGNPFLSPEIANTLSAGLVLRPAFLPGLNVSLDYYDIKLADAIQTLSIQQTLNACEGGDTTLCNFVSRGPSGNLISVTNVYANLARITTRGFDMEASYRRQIGPGTLDLRVLGNYLKNFIVDLGSSKVDYAGDISTYGIPKWSWDFGTSYRVDGTSFDVDVNRIGAGKYSIANAATIQNNDVGGVWYLGVGAQQAIKTRSGELTIYARIDNLLNEKPPLFFPTANAGGNYDRIGRYMKVGARMKM